MPNLDRRPFSKLKTWFECVEERDAEIARLKADYAGKVRVYGEASDIVERQVDEIARLRAALKPFAKNVYATSLVEALGHIGREDLERAREALKE